MASVRIGRRFQGPTGSGQGGWASHLLVAGLDHPATVSLRAPVPLDVDLRLETSPDSARLIDGTADGDVVILEATQWVTDCPSTPPVSIDEARAARRRFPFSEADHPAPLCFSCGFRHDSMRVHAGPLGDGRWATDWTAPEWAVDETGAVDDGVLWAALDCCTAWFVCTGGGHRPAVTVQLAVDVARPVSPGETLALVSWAGDHLDGWNGRKRGAAAVAFAADGTCVARSRSFWVAIQAPGV